MESTTPIITAPLREQNENNEKEKDPNALQLARQRALAFEREYEESIDELKKVEVFLKELLMLRKNWLSKDCTSKHLDFETTKKQFEILKLQADILSSQVDLDKFTLESYYESQQLKQLVEGTKPTEPNDPQGKMREVKMERIMREGAEDLKRSLTESILFRQKASSESKRLVSMLDNKQTEKAHNDQMINEDADNTLTLFVDRAKKSLHKTKTSLKLVTGNYLVLRHNSRMATAVLTKSRNEIALQRKKLRENYKQLELEVEAKKLQDEESRKTELEIQIRRQRSEVMKYESELELKWNENEDIREQQNKSIKDIKLAIKTYDAQYKDLQIRRRKELVTVQGQLTRLREELSVAEEAVYTARRNKNAHRLKVSTAYISDMSGPRSRPSTSTISSSTRNKTSSKKVKSKNNSNAKFAQFCSREHNGIDGFDDRRALRDLQERMYELKENLEEL